MSEKIPPQRIRLDGGTQSRAGINNDVVTEYSAAYKAGEEFPDIDVFFDGTNYWCGDGFHRALAAQRAGLKTINVRVHQGTRRDAMLFSAGANARHGLRRTNEDKHRAVEMLLADDEWNRWSNVEIARRCGVSEFLVRSLRPHFDLNEVTDDSSKTTGANSSGQRTYTNKHGGTSTMQTGNIGKSSTVVRYERDAEDQTPPDNAISIVYAPPGTPHGYDWTDDDQPIIYGDSFYVADHIKRLIVVWPYSSKDAAWNMYPKLNPVPGTNFHTHMGTMGLYAYLTPEEYTAQLTDEPAAPAPSITDGIPEAPVNVPVDQDDSDEAEDIDLNDEPPVDDEDAKQLDLPAASPEQLPFDDEDPNDPDPFANGYEVTPFGRQPIKPKPESKVSAEAGSVIDTATSLRELAASLSNKGVDTSLSRWEADQVDVMQGAKQIYADRQNGESAPVETPAPAPVPPPPPALDPLTVMPSQLVASAKHVLTGVDSSDISDLSGRVLIGLGGPHDKDTMLELQRLTGRLISLSATGNLDQVIVIVPAWTSDVWFSNLWAHPICFCRVPGRLPTPQGEVSEPDSLAVIYFGHNAPGFIEEFDALHGPVAITTRMFRRLDVDFSEVFADTLYEAVTE